MGLKQSHNYFERARGAFPRARGPLRRRHRPARGRGHRHAGRLDRRQRPPGRRRPPLLRRLLGGRGRPRRAEERIGESRTWRGSCACMEAALQDGFFVSTRFLCSSRRPHPLRQLGFRIPTRGARCRWGSLALARAVAGALSIIISMYDEPIRFARCASLGVANVICGERGRCLEYVCAKRKIQALPPNAYCVRE